MYSLDDILEADCASSASTLYSPLEKDDIRLLTASSTDGENVICHLKTYQCSLAPAYDVVSYCWGKEKATTPITCNGRQLEIRQNLHTALKYIYQYRRPPARPLWVDAICLNQDDDDEKAVQVLRMGEIYTAAARTLIWLGEDVRYRGEAVTFLEWFAKRMVIEAKSSTPEQDLKGPMFKPALKSLGDLLIQPWFSRIWVVQELVLSKNTVVMHGHKSIDWSAFVTALSSLDRMIKGAINLDHVTTGLLTFYSSDMHGVLFLDAVRMEYKRSHSLRFFQLMNLCEGKNCEEPVDRIWAFLGLMDRRLSRHVEDSYAVRYDHGGRRDYWVSYLAFMKRLFLACREDFWTTMIWSQGLLWYHDGQRKFMTYRPPPSWCPDFSAPRLCGSFRTHAWAGSPDSTHQNIPKLSLCARKSWLFVSGFAIDTVHKTQAPRIFAGRGGYKQQKHIEAFWTWIQECCPLVDEVLGDSNDAKKAFYQTLIAAPGKAEHLKSAQAVDDQFDHVSSAFEAGARHLPPQEVDGPRWPEGFNHLGFIEAHGRSFFSTVNGRIGLGPPHTKPGDAVVVFPNTQALFVLRKSDAIAPKESIDEGDKELSTANEEDSKIPQERHELVGDAYVYGLMEGEAFTVESRDPDTTFVLV